MVKYYQAHSLEEDKIFFLKQHFTLVKMTLAKAGFSFLRLHTYCSHFLSDWLPHWPSSHRNLFLFQVTCKHFVIFLKDFWFQTFSRNHISLCFDTLSITSRFNLFVWPQVSCCLKSAPSFLLFGKLNVSLEVYVTEPDWSATRTGLLWGSLVFSLTNLSQVMVEKPLGAWEYNSKESVGLWSSRFFSSERGGEGKLGANQQTLLTYGSGISFPKPVC